MKGILAAGTEHEGVQVSAPADVPAHLRGWRGLFDDLEGDRDERGAVG